LPSEPWRVRRRPIRRKSSTGWRGPLAPETPIPHRSNGLANAKLVATERIDGVIHSVDPEPARESQSIADSNSWTNGDMPVK
jgi:hypothetical protein